MILYLSFRIIKVALLIFDGIFFQKGVVFSISQISADGTRHCGVIATL